VGGGTVGDHGRPSDVLLAHAGTLAGVGRTSLVLLVCRGWFVDLRLRIEQMLIDFRYGKIVKARAFLRGDQFTSPDLIGGKWTIEKLVVGEDIPGRLGRFIVTPLIESREETATSHGPSHVRPGLVR
jgi:hypothetical protein